MFARLNHLPRDSRDTLFLLLVIAWVILPQLSNLPVWCSTMAAGVLLWRGWLAAGSKPLPSRWWLALLLIVALAATAYTYKTILGRDAGVTLTVVLLALKTLELRAKRDAFVVFFLSFFTMLTNFFFSQSLLTAAAMLLALLGLLTALVNAHMPVGRPPLLQAAKTAGWMALLGAPVMAILFVLFPRMAPLWGVPGDAMVGRTGLSNSMKVGTIASLALDESIAMRVKFLSNVPAQSDLYFRGPVLSSFDGREWLPPRGFAPQANPPASLKVSGDAVRYEVTLEPSSRPWLPVLDAATARPKITGFEVLTTSDLQWLTDRPINDLTRYSAESFTQFTYGPANRASGLQQYVDLPPGFNPRTTELAGQLRNEMRNRGSADPAINPNDAKLLVEAVLNKLRTGGYGYTLDPGLFGQHTADEFWFDRKEGFCEHIASSFVILMRALNVPARIVTGYQGGEQNAIDGFWTIRQSDAHAWAEVWIAGRGWVRVDPTSVVAPGRTGSYTRLQPQRGVIASAFNGVLGTVNPSLLANLRAAWEATNNRWNQWVLNYSEAKQLNLLKTLGFDSPSWQDLGYVLAGLLVTAGLTGALWTLWDRNRQDPWLRLLHLAQDRLAKAGLPLPANTPPRRMAERIRAAQDQSQVPAPRFSPAIGQWLLNLEAARYSPNANPAVLNHLRQEFKLLSWPG